MSRSLLVALVAALAAVMPAAARAQAAPTLTFDKPCYAEGDPMAFSGSGYTPGGEVDFLFRSLSNGQMGSYTTAADGTGAIGGAITAPRVDAFVADDDVAATIGTAATDKTRVEQGAPPEQQFAGTMFRFTQWGVQVERPGGGAPKVAKPMRVRAYGYTRAIGKTLYLHYRRGGRTLKRRKLGRLGGDCGDLTRTLPRGLPRGLRPGRYQLVLNTSKRAQGGERVWFNQRFR